MSKPTRPWWDHDKHNDALAYERAADAYMDALEAENAELRESVQFNKDVAAEMGADYLDTYAKLKRAVKLLESSQICADANGHRALSRQIEDFLSEMEDTHE
jgi:hypothetical protein